MAFSRPILTWKVRGRQLELGERTLIMGVVNVTPDSFSDGGRFLATEAAIRQGQALADAGADILDLGGESTRPGAPEVSAAEELERVLPVVEALLETDLLISIDTTKSAVAEAALAAGAHIVNDVSAGEVDPRMPGLVAETGAGYVIMHMQGTPRTMQDDPTYVDAVPDIRDYLSVRMSAIVDQHVAPGQLVVDPGIGFGKTLEHNLQILARLQAFADLERPVLVGLSRKSFLGHLTGRDVEERLAGSLAGLSASILHGAHILRVHDVRESRDAADILDAVLKEAS